MRIATLNTWLDGWFGYEATPKVTEEKIATWNIADNHQFNYSCDCMVQCVKMLYQYVELHVKFIKFSQQTFGTASEINKISQVKLTKFHHKNFWSHEIIFSKYCIINHNNSPIIFQK